MKTYTFWVTLQGKSPMKVAEDGRTASEARTIVEARWLSSNKSATLHQLAAKFDVSAERIRQIEQNALIKLKTLMLPDSSI